MLVKKSSPYLPELAVINRAEMLTATERFFEIEFKSGRDLDHKPGQFVEVSVFGVGEAPISVSSSPTQKGMFELAVRKVGNVTTALHNLKIGSTLGIRGPLGTNFPTDNVKGRDILVIGGGIGLIPLRSYIHYILANRHEYGRLIILAGARAPQERLFTNELAAWNADKNIEFLETLDKGDKNWQGNVGLITTLIPKVEVDPQNMTAVVVGPPIMYRFVIKELLDRKINQDDIYVSLERRMKCGIGKCGHCQINDIYCCKDGPVFKYSDIAGLEEAL
ncbi:MAG: FAD/NAD(P)-binding protein [Pseudomonadota bacterium]